MRPVSLHRERSPIAALADRQHGVVAYRQLVALGFSHGAIKRLLGKGWLHPIHRGVYAVGYRKLTPKGYWMAAVLARGPDALLSHYAAAALWALRPSNSTTIDVTVPTRGRQSRPQIRVHCSATLQPADITCLEGIPVTSLARTLLDLAAVLRPDPLITAIEAAERLQLFDLRAIERTLACNPRRHGNRALRQALAAYHPPTTTKSGFERHILRRLHAAGVPEPHVNTIIAGHEVDLYFPSSRLVVELDGSQYHQSPRQLERDRIKDAILQRHGCAVLRITEERARTDLDGAIDDIIALATAREAS